MLSCPLGASGYSERLGGSWPSRSDKMACSSMDVLIVLGKVAKDVQSGNRLSVEEVLGRREEKDEKDTVGCGSRSSFSWHDSGELSEVKLGGVGVLLSVGCVAVA